MSLNPNRSATDRRGADDHSSGSRRSAHNRRPTQNRAIATPTDNLRFLLESGGSLPATALSPYDRLLSPAHADEVVGPTKTTTSTLYDCT